MVRGTDGSQYCKVPSVISLVSQLLEYYREFLLHLDYL